MGKLVAQAFEKEDCQKFKEAGIQIYHPNYEVWDRELFKKICPGKEAWIGYDTWIRRVVDSAEVFGPENLTFAPSVVILLSVSVTALVPGPGRAGVPFTAPAALVSVKSSHKI
jgi:hypothetical protein